MRMSQFKGYLLEDVVAYLLKQNGFELLSHRSVSNRENFDGSREFEYFGNGYNIQGRGGKHQFDTIGTFKWNIPFLNPIRLFVEAKFNKKPIGIEIVRNGIALINDVNQNLNTISMNNNELSLPKYNYQYVIFSASGFTNPAITMALAHNIILVDLNGNNYKFILNKINNFINSLNQFNRNAENHFSIDESLNESISKEKAEAIRSYLRTQLFDVDDYLWAAPHALSSWTNLRSTIENFAESFKQTEKLLYLANTGGAYTLVMSTVNNENFQNSIKMKPTQDVEITWDDGDEDTKRNWIVTNKTTAHEFSIPEFRLEFSLPLILSNYIFKDNENDYHSIAANTKSIHFNNINIILTIKNKYSHQDDIIMCSLKYDAESTERIINEQLGSKS